ncbi:MAG: hypothetical protein ACE5GC_04385 [Acidimicrobiia bacterium]
MRTRFASSLAALLAALALPGTAAAAETDGSGSDTATGAGTVWAKGAGIATIDGGGKAKIAIDGDVLIVDRAGDADVRTRSRSRDKDARGDHLDQLAATTRYELSGFRGVVVVTGSDFIVELDGRMAFRAGGKGTVYVNGRGAWRTRHAGGTWNGARVAIGDRALAAA